VRAVILRRFGGPSCVELGEWPEPSPKPGELQVAVRCAGLNPVDFKIRAKKMWPLIRYAPPLVMGNELAGVVTKVGEGVRRFKPGDRVLARSDTHAVGAFADLICLSEGLVAHVPDNVGFREAAGFSLGALTAEQALFEVGKLERGQRCFIHAGAGGFGTLALQFAKRAGAHVATTASGVGLELVKRLGADEVVDYKSQRFEDVLKDFDLVLDTLGGQAAIDSFKCLKRGGIVVSVGGVPTVESARQWKVPWYFQPAFTLVSRNVRAAAKAHGCRYAWLLLRPDGAQLETLVARLGSGELQVVVDKVFPFAQALDALAYQEAGRAKGKVILEVTSESR
jgi:alcohol dehydrogenase